MMKILTSALRRIPLPLFKRFFFINTSKEERVISKFIPMLKKVWCHNSTDIWPSKNTQSRCSVKTYSLLLFFSHLPSIKTSLSYPISPGWKQHVKNSSDFVTFVTSHQLENEIMVFFDVVSLFTKVPTKLAIQVPRQRLEEDANITDTTTLSIDNIIYLLEFCLDATYFSFRGKYYKQIFGTAMGSPVSVTVANMVMENVDQRALSSFDYQPLFWKWWYVD